MKIFFSVGEPSGDLHGANLIRELQQHDPGIECVGFGGPRMAAAGGQLLEDLTRLAVMWFARALANLHHFVRLFHVAKRYFRDHRPDAVVLIDYPGFNWWIARAAKRQGIPVFYYGAPQMWAWAAGVCGKCAASWIMSCASCRSRNRGLPAADARPRTWAILTSMRWNTRCSMRTSSGAMPRRTGRW